MKNQTTTETATPVGVPPLATGSPAGDAPTQPKPLPCRLADLLKDWKETRDNMKKRGEEEAALAVEVCAEMLHGEVSAFFAEVKAWREHSAKQENKKGDTKHDCEKR